MKKVLVVLMALSLFVACDNDKNGKEKVDRDKKSTDDYRSADKKDDVLKADEEKKSDESPVDNKPGGGDSWTSSESTSFMSECESTATKNVGPARANEYCDCLLQKLKARYSSYGEANSMLTGPNAGTQLQKLADECNSQ